MSQSSDLILLIFISICLCLIGLITTIGNLIVLLAFYCDKKLRTINDYFILNMAIADFLVGFICIPFYIPFSLKQIWPFGRFFCKIWVTIDDVATMASVINIVAISINRYWSIAYPISYRKYAKQDFVYLSMGVVWFISFINFAPGIWLISLFDKNISNRNDCSGDYSRSFVYMLIAQFNYFIWPFFVLCILNILIMFNLWKRTRKMNRQRSFSYPKTNPKTLNIYSKLIRNRQDLSIRNSSKLNCSSHQTLTDKVKSSSSCVEGLRSSLEQSSPILKSRNSIKLKSNGNSLKDRRSNRSRIFLRKSSNRNCRSSGDDSIVKYDRPRDLQFIQPITNQIRSDNIINGRDLRIIRDRKAARSLFILVFIFLIFLFPYVICAIATTAGFNIPETVFQISFWLLWMNSTCNPFLYPFIQIKYRRAYSKLFQTTFRCRKFQR